MSNRTRAGLPFQRDEWNLLVQLPGRVVVAATSAESDTPRRTVGEALAGIDAIAAGRTSTSRLVRDIVASIDERADDDPPAAEEFSEPAAGIADVLDACRAAAGLLAGGVDRADSDAYRQWIEAIAARVCEESRSGGPLHPGGARISPAERRFLEGLAAALAG